MSSSWVPLNVNVVFFNLNVLRTCESCRDPFESFHSGVCSGPLVALYITVKDSIRYGAHEVGGLSPLLRWHVMWERAVHSAIVQQSSSEEPTQTLWFSHVIGALWEQEACENRELLWLLKAWHSYIPMCTYILLYNIISSGFESDWLLWLPARGRLSICALVVGILLWRFLQFHCYANNPIC